MSGPSTDLVAAVPAFADELTVGGLVLRTPVHDDVPALAPAFVDPAVGGEAGLPPLDEEQLHAIIDGLLPQLRASGELVPYVIVDTATGDLLGGVTLRNLDLPRETIEVGYWLFAHARGRGVATQALGAIVDWSFANGIHRVEAAVRVGNSASERVLERGGFAREGVKRRYLRHGDTRVDATLFARLADDA